MKQNCIFAIVAVLVIVSAPRGSNAAITDLELTGINEIQSSTFDRRRETCWRTNRSTGQRFRIC